MKTIILDRWTAQSALHFGRGIHSDIKSTDLGIVQPRYYYSANTIHYHHWQSSTMNTCNYCTNKTPSPHTPWRYEHAQALTVEQRKTWQTLIIENTDMTHNSEKARSLVRKLSNDPRKADQHFNVTQNQVAHQLILNSKAPRRQRHSKIKQCCQENHDFDGDFTRIELQNSLKNLKNGKAAGLDEILTGRSRTSDP